MKYKFLPHPAELRLRVYGKTIEELFINAAEAMVFILKRGTMRIGRGTTQKIETMKIQSNDINSLLVDFLSEILAKSQIRKAVYRVSSVRYRVLKNKKFQIEAKITGYPVEKFDEDIKATTYQDVNVRQLRSRATKQLKWQTDIVLFSSQ